MTCSDEDRDRSRRPDAEDRGWSHRSSTQWPGGREVGVEPQNQGGGGFLGLGLKTDSSDLVIWVLKITATVSWFVP
jgi:hypothetical protein